MGVVRCTLSRATGSDLIKSENSGANAETTSRTIRGDKLPLVFLMISLWAFQCRVSEVAGKALPFPAAVPPRVPPSHNRLAPAAGPEVPKVHAPSPIGEAPQQSAPPTQSAAPKQSDPLTQEPAAQLVQFQQVLSSLRVNNYTVGAQYVSDYLFLLPLDSTLFVPTNAAFHGVNTDQPSATLGPVLAYHAILQQLSYQQITLLPVGTRFATMIANNYTIEITGVAPDDLRVDDVRLVQRDVCSSDTLALQISCHGVDGIFNMTAWGTPSLPPFGPIAPQLSPVPSPASSHSPTAGLALPSMLPPAVSSPRAMASAPTPAPA